MNFAFIEAEKVSFPIHRMCHALGISQSVYFAWRSRLACQRQRQDMVYLAIVHDLHSRRVIGWETSDRLKRSRAIEALRRSITTRIPTPGLLRHFDRG